MELNIKGLRDLNEKQLLIVSISVISLIVIVMGVVIYLGYSKISELNDQTDTADAEAKEFEKTTKISKDITDGITAGKKYVDSHYKKWFPWKQDTTIGTVIYDAGAYAAKKSGTLWKTEEVKYKQAKGVRRGRGAKVESP